MKETAWNGISLSVPEFWHPAVILNNYLLFEEQYSPVFEIKWQEVRGRFNPQSLLHKLEKKQSGLVINHWDLPPLWQKSLALYSAHGFHWQSNTGSGSGALLYCLECRRAILLQFHGTVTDDETTIADILTSLQDHTAELMQPWAIFDIKARLPVSATLLSQEFVPGRFTLTLDMDEQKVSLLRFKPAAELLRNQTLPQFATKLTGIPATESDLDPFTVHLQQRSTGMQRFLARLRRLPSDSSLHLRHITADNIILGIQAQGRQPIEPDLIQTLARHFNPI